VLPSMILASAARNLLSADTLEEGVTPSPTGFFFFI